VKLAVPDVIYHEVAPAVLEGTLFPLSDDGRDVVFVPSEIGELVSNIRTAAFGMGIGVSEGAGRILEYLLDHFTGTLIVDADGLTLLSRLGQSRIRSAACSLILTPHLKEFSRLSGLGMEEIQAAPVAAAETYAAENRVVLLLKGPSTVVTDGKTTCLTDAGCPGMATAGSGDVLSGILAAVAAFAPDRLLAAAAAAFINGKAGEAAQRRVGPVSLIASDTVSALAALVADRNKP